MSAANERRFKGAVWRKHSPKPNKPDCFDDRRAVRRRRLCWSVHKQQQRQHEAVRRDDREHIREIRLSTDDDE